jgi:hypothetical protein
MSELDARIEAMLAEWRYAIENDRPRPSSDDSMLVLLEAMAITRQELAAVRSLARNR